MEKNSGGYYVCKRVMTSYDKTFYF